MAQELEEILITLFNNPDGMTLSVTPNYSQGGKRVNFSFKGTSTHNNMKAFVDGIGAMQDTNLRMFFEEQKNLWRKKVHKCREHGIDCWLSKGYLSTGTGKKGKTAPCSAFLVSGKEYFTLQLQLGPHWYECDLETSAISPAQQENNAIAGHRWRKQTHVDEYSTDFLGGGT